ncbi:Proline porter II [Budvicia aquatica]|uniref:Proline porter II n=1 Tax=Budvicia aquatica TaxID=82979 RepID=A0A484ZDK1_9GAMM|nr:Proline porter II [Budvicia aquatica]
MKFIRKRATPLQINDITIIDDAKLKKAITAAALGNAMEWFDFGVYGFVAYALGQVFFPGASPGIQMIAALGDVFSSLYCPATGWSVFWRYG